MSTRPQTRKRLSWFHWLIIGALVVYAVSTVTELLSNISLLGQVFGIHLVGTLLSVQSNWLGIAMGDRTYSLGTLRLRHRYTRRLLGLPVWTWWPISFAVARLLGKANDTLGNLAPTIPNAMLIGFVAAIHLSMTGIVIFASWRTLVASGDELAAILTEEGVCPQCRYPGGHIGTCPECGHRAPSNEIIVVKLPQTSSSEAPR